MNARRRLLGASLALSILAAVGGLLGGSTSGCGGPIGYSWLCCQSDGGGCNGVLTEDPGPTRPADCVCALGGPFASTPTPQGDCAWLDAGAEGGPIPACSGQCVVSAPPGFSNPLLVWMGPDSERPDGGCPPNAAGAGWEGWTGLTSSPLPCGTCACEPSTGSCAPPASITASTAPCNLGGTPIPFGAPPAWDGGCTSFEASTTAVEAVAATPLVVDAGCNPVSMRPPMQQDPVGTWSLYALACTSSAGGSCLSTGETCAPAPPSGSGFRLCVAFYGAEVSCSDLGPYQDTNVFYAGSTDDRTCAPCTCSPPSGDACSALLSVYSGSACDEPTLLASETLTAAQPICFGISDAGIGSKAMGPATYTAGTCVPSDAGSIGNIVAAEPVTFCCLP